MIHSIYNSRKLSEGVTLSIYSPTFLGKKMPPPLTNSQQRNSIKKHRLLRVRHRLNPNLLAKRVLNPQIMNPLKDAGLKSVSVEENPIVLSLVTTRIENVIGWTSPEDQQGNPDHDLSVLHVKGHHRLEGIEVQQDVGVPLPVPLGDVRSHRQGNGHLSDEISRLRLEGSGRLLLRLLVVRGLLMVEVLHVRRKILIVPAGIKLQKNPIAPATVVKDPVNVVN